MGKSEIVEVEVSSPLPIATKLSIRTDKTSGVAPLAVTVTCRLTRVDNDEGINGEPVSLYINGVLHGTKNTTSIQIVTGYAVWDVTLQQGGTYAFQAEYVGSSVYEGC